MTTTNNVELMVEDKALRDQCIERVDVLDKVKELLLLPGLEMMTAAQTAEFYEVDTDVIRQLYKRNKEEIDLDGTKLQSAKEICNVTGCHVTKSSRAGTEIEVSDNIFILIPHRGIRCFSKRAILRIGMLLRDSDVAREVRTQLLNIEEHTDMETKVTEIENEQALAIEYLNALGSEDLDSIQTTANKFLSYYKRHINALTDQNAKLEMANSALAGDTQRWEPRNVVNRLVRKYATVACSSKYGVGYDKFYQEVYYKYGISLRARAQRRGTGNLMDTVNGDEWGKMMKVAAAMCEEVGVDIANVLGEENVRMIHETETEGK